MKEKRNALGKGLSALLSDAEDIMNGKAAPAADDTESKGPMSISEVAIADITPNPFQPRVTFDEEALAELAESIRNVGVIQPITLRRVGGGKYQIISGERRYRAAQAASLDRIPAYVRDADDAGMLEMAIVENIQRENLDPIETALSFQRLIDECNLTQEAMADRVGKKRASVTNYLRMLRLPAEIQKALKAGAISMGHAKVLLSVEDELEQLQLCKKTIEGDWSVRSLEDKVKKMARPARPDTDDPGLPEEYYRAIDIVGKYFDNNVTFKRSTKGSGTMTIRFKDDNQMARFIKALEQGNI